MATIAPEDISSTVLRRMREGGFDFARVHPIEFYAIFPDEARARQAARNFRGESLNAQVSYRDGAWHLQVSKVMYATHSGIDDFEHNLQELVGPLGGVLDGWGVTQEMEGERP
ncbi:ribonuclease E inhibitor RraB [Pseudomonas oryzae]|uniref:Regulator of ribonuclease activity B n=1 Tax=Pseudomonas oryzae TaxID=1392877 RepID=A0A1H1SA94_9PSED|nr:ribonuclease E inhibitor RraB [Pseudomonas oryzae]SDS45050.1 Regulator of ribonuclease activity B [Pseudomonas oryzae]